MNKFTLIIALTIALPWSIIHTTEKQIEQSQIQGTMQQTSSISKFMRHLIDNLLCKKSFNQSPFNPTSVDFFQNQSQLLAIKLRSQQLSLLAALAKNNDALIQNLNDPLPQPRNIQSSLSTSRELLSLISEMSKYLNSTSV